MSPYCTGTALLHRDKEMTQIWMSEIITTTLSNCIRYRAAAISDTVPWPIKEDAHLFMSHLTSTLSASLFPFNFLAAQEASYRPSPPVARSQVILIIQFFIIIKA